MREWQPKKDFLLDPDITFLNHGSFGATPRPVFETYQDWQRKLETQPVKFLGRDIWDFYTEARGKLGNYLGSPADNLVFVPNATFGLNIVLKSLSLKPGEEILTTDHEYGACDNAMRYVCNKTGALLVRQPVALPADDDEIVDVLWKAVNQKTRVIFISHISSSTAKTFPVKEICSRAKGAGILTIIDGAHAPGQLDLNLNHIGADFYVGNCHKWMLAPKGAGFLYTHPDVQYMIEPLIVSWGWGDNAEFDNGSDFLNYLQWWGTMDPAAALTVPAAIDYMCERDWPLVRERCQDLLRDTLKRITNQTGKPSVYSPGIEKYIQMAVAELPLLNNRESFKQALYDRYQVEVPVIEWNSRHFIRISIQAYNSEQDLDCLISALTELIPEFSR